MAYENPIHVGVNSCRHAVVLPGSRDCPDSKVHGANMGLIWGRQDPGGLHVNPMNFAIWVVLWNGQEDRVMKPSRSTFYFILQASA